MLNMNTKTQNNFDTPSKLFAVETSNLSNEAIILLTEEKSVKRSLRRIRNKKYPSLCPLSELKINGIWTTTGGPEPKPFLLFDNENNTNRIIVFASPEGMLELSKSVKWCMDGTIFTCPKEFYQVYMIHACIKNTSVPCVYALLQKKTKDIYVELLSTLRSILSELKLKTISIDFAQSMIQAIELVFVDVNIQYCYYHLSQSMSVLYDLSNYLNDPDIDELLLYFNRTYVNETYKRTTTKSNGLLFGEQYYEGRGVEFDLNINNKINKFEIFN
ncbi:hypothetical protein QTP88_014897 [Uroleucon formosanum]